MRDNTINESIARQLKGRKHATGEFVSCESRGGKITMTSICNQCNGPHSNISLANAAQAVQHDTIQLISCQHCTRVIAAPAKLTYEQVIQIPERQRTADQDRIILEHDFAIRKAQTDRAKNAPIEAARAEVTRQQKSKLWDARERFLLALAHTVGATLVNDPRVLQHAAYVSWEQWQAATEETREAANRASAEYFLQSGLRFV